MYIEYNNSLFTENMLKQKIFKVSNAFCVIYAGIWNSSSEVIDYLKILKMKVLFACITLHIKKLALLFALETTYILEILIIG